MLRKFHIPAPLVTREHGSWAVLIVPFVVAVTVAGSFSVNVLLLALLTMAVFLNYVPAQALLKAKAGVLKDEQQLSAARFWSVLCLTAGAFFLIPLLVEGYWLLLPVGALGLASFLGNFYLTRFVAKSIASDLVAVFGLTLSAPTAFYVAGGVLDWTAVELWLLSFLFFGGSIFYVHMKIKAKGTKKADLSFKEKLSLGRLTLLYHFFVLLIVIYLGATRYSWQLAVVAFVPMTIHAVYGTIKLSNRVQFKRLGLLLLGQSVLFALLLLTIGRM